MAGKSFMMSGRPDEILARGVVENQKYFLSTNPQLTPLQAHKLAVDAALRDNPSLLSTYRSYGKGNQ
jgi:hypothetical protein